MKKALFFLYTIIIMATTSYSIAMQDTADYKSSFFLNVDYLFWQAITDQTQYALKVPGGVASGGFLATPKNIIETQRFKAGSGVRLRAGYTFCNWDIALAWTHFNKCTFVSVSGTNEIFATPLFGFVDFIPTSAADSRWCIKFDTIDLEFAYINFCSSCFDLRPFIGLKGVRINRDQSMNYPDFPGFNNVNVNRKTNFWGIGPRLGFDAKLFFWRNLHILSTASGSLLLSTFDARWKSVISLLPPVTSRFIEKQRRVRPTAQILLGLGWEQPICSTVFEIAVGYELQYWWNLSKVVPGGIDALLLSPSGDLALHGLTVRTGIRF